LSEALIVMQLYFVDITRNRIKQRM